MKLLTRVLFACCLVLFTACPALAELKVQCINRTDFEIQAIRMTGDAGSMASAIRVVPDNFCVFRDGTSSELQELVIDAGMMLFDFTDTKAVAGMSDLVFELSFDADDRPHLTLVDKPVRAEEDTVPAGASFDLPAGPIWDNDHARERCPQVLEEWLSANPGRKAKWNGNWATVKPGEMSVCGMDPVGGSPAPPSLINLVGKATLLADASVPKITDFADIARAGTMGDLRSLGARDATMWDSQVYLPARFLGKTWAVFVDSSEVFTRNDADKAGNRTLRTYTGGPEGIAPLMQGLAAEGYRPWYAQLTAGEEMDLEENIQFWKEDLDVEEAWEQVADASEHVNREGEPAAVDTILLTGEDYARAARGEDPTLPGFRLRVSNAAVITLQYHRDISMLIAMTR